LDYCILAQYEKADAEIEIKGVYTALVTPFSRGRIDIGKYSELVQLARDAGLSGIVPIGTTGESPALSADERNQAVAAAAAASGQNFKVIAGAGTNNTVSTVENIKRAADLGADAVLVVTPYYNKPTPEGQRRHFLTAADRSDIPLVLYHIPGRCGVGIPLDLVIELAKHPMIVAIKEAGGDVWRSGEIVRRAPHGFAVLSGDDSLTLPLMSVGAVGTIAVISNIAPRMTKRMVDFALSGNFVDALAVHRQLSPLLNALSLETNPGPIKEAMNLSRMKVGPVRLPLAGVQPKTRKAIKVALKHVGRLE